MMKDKEATQQRGDLTEIQWYVIKQQGTEKPFSGKLLHNHREGVYCCLCCGSPLFNSDSKYDAGCGWPSFFQSLERGNIRYLEDTSHQMKRTEIRCAHCDAHLGHLFPDGPLPTGERFCVNSASLSFVDAQSGEKTSG